MRAVNAPLSMTMGEIEFLTATYEGRYGAARPSQTPAYVRSIRVPLVVLTVTLFCPPTDR